MNKVKEGVIELITEWFECADDCEYEPLSAEETNGCVVGEFGQVLSPDEIDSIVEYLDKMCGEDSCTEDGLPLEDEVTVWVNANIR